MHVQGRSVDVWGAERGCGEEVGLCTVMIHAADLPVKLSSVIALEQAHSSAQQGVNAWN